MRKFIISAFLLFPCFPKAQQMSFLFTRGKFIITEKGTVFQMKGINLGNWLVPEGYMFLLSKTNSPRLINEALDELLGPSETDSFWKKFLENYITADDIHFLKQTGVNSIRVPFNYRLFTDQRYLGEADSLRGFRLLDPLVRWCRREGIYLILDMHCAPGGQTGDNIDDGTGYPFLFKSRASQIETCNIWKRIAAHYKDEPAILGYDLLNEPIATYFDKNEFNASLEPLYKEITRYIRTVDKNHIIILGGAQWDSNFDPFGEPFDPKLVYSFHKYWTPAKREVISPYLAFRDKFNVPIYCGETGENTNGWIDSFRRVLDTQQIGWHFWPYKKLRNERCLVQIKEPDNYQLFIDYAEAPRGSFADIRKARPQRIEDIKKALWEYLAHSLFSKCQANNGYIHALGFHLPGDTKNP